MHIAGGRVDMGVTEKGLHHNKIDTGFGERGPERVSQRVRMTAGHAGQFTVITEHPSQTLECQWQPACRALRDDEQPAARRFGTFDQQIGLDDAGDIDVERDAALLGAFAVDQQPTPADIDIGDVKVKDLS